MGGNEEIGGTRGSQETETLLVSSSRTVLMMGFDKVCAQVVAQDMDHLKVLMDGPRSRGVLFCFRNGMVRLERFDGRILTWKNKKPQPFKELFR